jgi:hypothetical protein
MGKWEGERARYMDYRRTLGYQMYGIMGVERDDKKGRAMAMNRNFEFFGAPVGLIITLDTEMGPPPWSDVGMFMQTFMLAAREKGLHTCAQEAWANWSSVCAEVCGSKSSAAPCNHTRTTRHCILPAYVHVGSANITSWRACI